jgi:sugar phosphate isomerase/epimerase
LVFEHLDEREKHALRSGELDLASMNALALEKTKREVGSQIEVIKELGMDHIELDTDPPNPYVGLEADERKRIKEMSESAGVTFSVHLPYSYVGGSICAPQESDRTVAVELHKRCVQFAADVGARYVNVHPGSVPFYHGLGKYKELIHDALFKSLLELGKMTTDLGIYLHLENNTAFDGIYNEVEDCVSIIRELREKDVDIYFNLDIGHWFTRADVGSQIPDPPENIMDELPQAYAKELHLNDYVPGKKMFHPPMHLEWGLLKRENLKRYAELVKRKGVEVIVLETALKTPEQVVNWREFLREETMYVKSIFG